jgi:hypothetical protein
VQFSGKAITMSGDFFAFVKRRTDLSDASIKDLTTMIEDYKGDTESFSFDFVRWDGAGKNKKVLSIVESNQSQHYEPIDHTSEAKLKFAQQLVRDYLKEILTKKHNIPFYAHNAYLYDSPSTSRLQKRKMDEALDLAFCCEKVKEDL